MHQISVIVPIYNVESYLEECVQAILNQSHTNLEVLLVNDGSTDSSPQLCDALAAKDTRVRVFHKRSMGVSAARNTGIDQARGQFITFVDADDVIDSDMLELLHTIIIDNKSDVAICRIQPFIDGQSISKDKSTSTVRSLTPEAAIINMLYQNGISNAPGGKLFKKELFSDVRFLKGVAIAEDLDINYKLFHNAKKIMYSSLYKYHYRQREHSAMHASFSGVRMDGLIVAKSLVSDAQAHYSSLVKATKNRLFMEAIYIAIDIPFRSKAFKKERRECAALIKSNSLTVFMDQNTKAKHRLYAAVAMVSAYILIALFKGKSLLRRVIS